MCDKQSHRAASAIKLVQYIFFIMSLGAGGYVVKSIVDQYLEGSTYFSDSKQNLTREDLPTATICIWASRNLSYGSDFTIQTIQNYHRSRSENTTLLDLREGKNEYVFRQEGMTFLRELKVAQNAAFSTRSCIAMDLSIPNDIIWIETDVGKGIRYQLATFMVSFSDNIANEEITKAVLYFTTQENSYGAVHYRWQDGEVQPIEMQRGGYQSLKIYKIERYEYLKNTCQETSFYECIGSKLGSSERCRENGRQCTPFSIPNQETLKDYPICENEQVISTCKEHRQTVHLECLNQKPCTIQEYSVEVDPLWSVNEGNKNLTETVLRGFLNDRVVNTVVEDLSNKYMIWANIESPRSTKGKYTKRVQKVVHKEYWALTEISLIGNIGGQLGLCVGFSFTGFIAWMLGLFPDVSSKIKSLCGCM